MASQYAKIQTPRVYLRYLSYVLRHKWFVFLECCKLGISWRGVVHDLTKFLPSEFFPYANHFAGGIRRGRDKTGYYKPTDTGDPEFDFAWFLHQKRNPHHWQYWIQPDDADAERSLVVLEIPMDVRKEMVADWRGAGRAQGTPDTLAWYRKNRNKIVLGKETRRWVEEEICFSGNGELMVTEEKPFWTKRIFKALGCHD